MSIQSCPWEGLKQQQHQREPREREGGEKPRWAEVAQTPWNVRNFPLLSHFPSSSLQGEHEHRTPGPRSTVQGRKLRIGTLRRAQLCQAEVQIIIPKSRAHLPQDTHLPPHRTPEIPAFPPKSWSSHGAVFPPPKKTPIYFQPVICCFPARCHPGEIPGNAIPCQNWNVSSLIPAEFPDFGQAPATTNTQPQQEPPIKATEVGGFGQGLLSALLLSV